MKKYKIYGFGQGFSKDWIFECEEVQSPSGMILLVGKFKGHGKKHTFIKNAKDIEITSITNNN